MANLQIKEYDPLAAPRTRRFPEEVWSSYQEIIYGLHVARYTRNEMLVRLANDHDFHPTPGQLISRMASWGYNVRKLPRPSNSTATTSRTSTEFTSQSSNPSLCFSAAPTTDTDSSMPLPDQYEDGFQPSYGVEDPGSCSLFSNTMEEDDFIAQNEVHLEVVDVTLIAPSLPPVLIREQPIVTQAVADQMCILSEDILDRSPQSMSSSIREFCNSSAVYRHYGSDRSHDGSLSYMSLDSQCSSLFARITGMDDRRMSIDRPYRTQSHDSAENTNSTRTCERTAYPSRSVLEEQSALLPDVERLAITGCNPFIHSVLRLN